MQYAKDGTVYRITTEQIVVHRKTRWVANWMCQCGLPGTLIGSYSSEFEAISEAKGDLGVHHDYRHRPGLNRVAGVAEN